MLWATLHEVTDDVSEEGGVLHLLLDVLLDIGLGVLHVFVNDGKHALWNLLWLVDLQEWVFVTSSLLAHGAEIKVLADTALVSDTNQRLETTAVASNVGVYNLVLGVDLVFSSSSELLAVHQLIEDVLALLVKLLLDESLEALSW